MRSDLEFIREEANEEPPVRCSRGLRLEGSSPRCFQRCVVKRTKLFKVQKVGARHGEPLALTSHRIASREYEGVLHCKKIGGRK